MVYARTTWVDSPATTTPVSAANLNKVEAQLVVADADVAALQYVPRKTVSTTTYTLILTDAGQALEFTNASGCIVTVPPATTAAFLDGTAVELRQTTAGAVTVAAGAGVTVNKRGTLTSNGQWAVMLLVNRGTNSWLLSGETTA